VVELTGASVSPRFATRETLRELYSYAFDQLGCQTVMQTARADDDHQAKLLPRYGFKRFDVPRLKGRNTDAAIYVLHDDVWRASKFHKEPVNG
jgi:RimJ/RimL family protein N-acetyltransferase